MISDKLILEAHFNLTRKKGRPEYAPTMEEIWIEIERILKIKPKKNGRQ